jgi:CheY-like chemotaxis protein
MKKWKILIIDDDEPFVESNRDLLEAYDFSVLSASNGPEGLRKARESKPDLIILDIMMQTDTEGLDVARRIRDIPDLKNVPVLMVTGVMRAMDIPLKLAADPDWLPVSHILEKPIDPPMLVREIKRLLKSP